MHFFEKPNPFERQSNKEEQISGVNHRSQIESIKQDMRKNKNESKWNKGFLILGDRGVGKTSFINIIKNWGLDLGFISIKITLTKSTTRSAWEFYKELYCDLLTELLEEKNLHREKRIAFRDSKNILQTGIIHKDITGSDDSKKKEEFNPNYGNPVKVNFEFINAYVHKGEKSNPNINTINRDLKKFSEYVDKKIVFLVDEAEYIYNSQDIIEIIRGIILDQENSVGFVFAGPRIKDNHKIHEIFGGVGRDFKTYNLNYFNDKDDVKTFFEARLNMVEWKESDYKKCFKNWPSVCQEIYDYSSGSIDIIIKLGRIMYDKGAENGYKMRLTGNMLDKVVNEQISSDENEVADGLSHNPERVEKILHFDENQRKWLQFIIINSPFTPLGKIFSWYSIFFTNENSWDKITFSNFIADLVKNNILYYVGVENTVALENKIGYESPVQKKEENLSNRVVYTGNKKEQAELRLKYMEKYNAPFHIKYNLDSGEEAQNLWKEITNRPICNFAASTFRFTEENKNMVFNGDGFYDDEEVPVDFFKFFENLKNGTIDFQTLAEKTRWQFVSYTCQISHKSIDNHPDLYIYDINLKNPELKKAFQGVGIDFDNSYPLRTEKYLSSLNKRNPNFSFKIYKIPKSNICTTDELINQSLNSGVKFFEEQYIEQFVLKLITHYTRKERGFDFTLPEAYFTDLKKIFDRNKGNNILDNPLNSLGFICLRRKKELAKEIFDFLIKEMESWDPSSKEYTNLFPMLTYNRAVVYFLDKDLENALKYLEKVLEFGCFNEDIEFYYSIEKVYDLENTELIMPILYVKKDGQDLENHRKLKKDEIQTLKNYKEKLKSENGFNEIIKNEKKQGILPEDSFKSIEALKNKIEHYSRILLSEKPVPEIDEYEMVKNTYIFIKNITK